MVSVYTTAQASAGNEGTVSCSDDVDYGEFRYIRWCEKCRSETCRCPKYVRSNHGTVLWMDGDIGTMMIAVNDDVSPLQMAGECYHDVDPETGIDNVYQLMEYMTGPLHGCIFKVRRVGDRQTLPGPDGKMIRSRRYSR